MKRVGVLAILVLAIALPASAGCMRCYVESGTGGTCGYDDNATYCPEACCWAGPGDPCRIPDFLYSCELAASVRAIITTDRIDARPFTNGQMVAEKRIAFYRRLAALKRS